MRKFVFLLLTLPFFCSAQIANMDVAFAEFEYDPGTCNGFRYATGSLIFVPANAFVAEDGSACKSKIIIRYRELHTKMDMLVSGVNMLLQRNGKTRMLESAGMFEISASCNGKPMKLATGKYIQVRLFCMRDIGKIESFIYDKEKRYWLDAGLPIYDFTFRENDNNANNSNLWGSGAVNADTIALNPEIENYNGVAIVNSIRGKLPEGYFKGMNINKLGMYNYDAVIKDEKAVNFTPRFVVNTGEAMNYPVYVAYGKMNSLIYYNEDDFAERFVLLPQKGIRIFTVMKDGSVAIANQDFMEKLNIGNLKGKQFTITLEKQPVIPKNKTALAEATRLK